MRKVICSCGQEVELTIQEQFDMIDGDRFVGFCSNTECRKRWELKETKQEYEEYLFNETIDPENGEYKVDGKWYYQDGKCME